MSETGLPGRHRLPVWLIVSVLVNVALAGLILGHHLAPKPERSARGGSEEMRVLHGIVSEAAPEDRKAIRDTFRSAFRDSRELRNARDKARARVGEAIAAEPYDAATVEVAFADLRDTDAALRASVQSVLAQQLSGVSPERRAALADAMTRPRDRHRRRGGDGERGDRPARMPE